MKRILCLILSLLLCSCAAAEWTCPYPTCGRTWDDQVEICNECGWEAPVHGLTVMLAGDDFLRVQWYGYMVDEVMLFYHAQGANGWSLSTSTEKHWGLINGLTPGTTYEVMLMDWNGTQQSVTAATTLQGVPAEDVSARMAELEATVAEQQATIDEQAAALAATPTPTPTPTPAPTSTPTPTSKPVAVGDYITFGHYPQTAEGTDNTPIEWLVLDVQGNKALVISRYGLDVHRYHSTGAYPTWAKSEIRTWLNSTFLNRAFTIEEQESIIITTIKTSGEYGHSGGADTQDQIWLLSVGEIATYFKTSEGRTTPTEYAVAQGAYQYDGTNSSYKLDGTGCCWWWLRSPGYSSLGASRVSYDGSLSSDGVNLTRGAIRPAFFLNLDSATIY